MLKVKPTVFREGLPANWNSSARGHRLSSTPPCPLPGTANLTGFLTSVHFRVRCQMVAGSSHLRPALQGTPPSLSPPLFCLSLSAPQFAFGIPDLWVPACSCGGVGVNPPLQQIKVHKIGTPGEKPHSSPVPLLWVLGSPCNLAQAKSKQIHSPWCPAWRGLQGNPDCKEAGGGWIFR